MVQLFRFVIFNKLLIPSHDFLELFQIGLQGTCERLVVLQHGLQGDLQASRGSS